MNIVNFNEMYFKTTAIFLRAWRKKLIRNVVNVLQGENRLKSIKNELFICKSIYNENKKINYVVIQV